MDTNNLYGIAEFCTCRMPVFDDGEASLGYFLGVTTTQGTKYYFRLSDKVNEEDNSRLLNTLGQELASINQSIREQNSMEENMVSEDAENTNEIVEDEQSEKVEENNDN